MKKHWALLAVLAFALGQQAEATPISLLDITGSGTTGTTADADQAIAAQFTLGKSYSNVAISADLTCVGCQGAIYLMQGQIGPGATLANFVTGETFNVSSGVSPLLSGLTLGAGDYFLIVSITTSGAGWTASDPATITSAPGVSAGPDYFASSINVSIPYESNFLVIQSASDLMFSITADSGTGSAPEPGTLGLFALSILGMIAARRRRFV